MVLKLHRKSGQNYSWTKQRFVADLVSIAIVVNSVLIIPWKNPANTMLIGTRTGIEVPAPNNSKQIMNKTNAAKIVR